MKVKTRQRLIVSVSGTTDMKIMVEGFGSRGGRRDLRCAVSGAGIAAVPVTEHLLRSAPVLEITSFGPPVLDPKQVSGVLDFRFRRFVDISRGFSFHGSGGFRGHSSPKPFAPLRSGCRALCISCHKAENNAARSTCLPL